MNKTPKEAKGFVSELKERLRGVKDREVVVCPPFVCLPVVWEVIRESNIKLGAQNTHYELKGAYTGEISPLFLVEIGCQYVIVGHSERREHFKEDDDLLNRKLATALRVGLHPIFCVGEKREERERGETFKVIEGQLRKGLKDIERIEAVTIAYEPVWAIGTGENATPEEAGEVHNFIRELLSKICDPKTVEGLRIIYGGSVTPENIDSLMAQRGIDGVLVGGASLKGESFERIVKFIG